MINAKMQEAINGQIQKEFYSAYLYLSMASYCEERSLNGFANWLKVQYQEEIFHALNLVNYLLERGGKVILAAIQAPPFEFSSMKDLFEKVLQHERYVTASINQLYGVAVEEKDFASQIFLEWYVNEQVEEEDNVMQILDKLAVIDENTGHLLFLDAELATRTFVPPTPGGTALVL